MLYKAPPHAIRVGVVDDMEMSVAGHSHVKNSVGYHQTDHLVCAVCDLKISVAGIHMLAQ